MNDKVYIYALIDPSVDKAFYVGSSNNPVLRVRTHLNGSGMIDIINEAVDEMRKKGVKPTYRLVDETIESERVEREKFWIRKFQEEGHPIINRWGRMPAMIGGYQPEPGDGGRVSMSVLVTKAQQDRILGLAEKTGGSKSEVIRGLIAFALEYIK